MTAPDRFTADHNRYHQEQDRLEALQASVDARATEIVEEVEGYRMGHDFGDYVWSSVTSHEPAERIKQLEGVVDEFVQYGCMLFNRVEPGITDDRVIIAREWLIAQIKEWAQVEARSELEEL